VPVISACASATDRYPVPALSIATTITRQQTFLEPDKSSHVAHSTVAIDTNKGVCLRFFGTGFCRQTDLW